MLYARFIPITDSISVQIPFVGDVLDHQSEYFSCISSIIATPYDMMAQLDNIGVDFTEITPFDLFCIMLPSLQKMDTTLVFGDLDLNRMHTEVNESTREVVIRDAESGVTIDRVVHGQICSAIRKMLNIEKKDKRPGNEEAKRYLLERAHAKLNRHKHRKTELTEFENYIIAFVNAEQSSYNFETVRHMTIYQFYMSMKQISHKIHFDNSMIGCYAGTIKVEDLRRDEKTWIRTV